MRHLTRADYRRMPWANGKGQTLEMIRVDGPDGLLWRLSMASVVEDGPFSRFPGIERNLTVISGPGFDLVGAVSLRADPLVPVAFPGDVAISAARVTAPCEDVNLMTARRLPLPAVRIAAQGELLSPRGLLGILALGPLEANGRALAPHDLCLGREEIRLAGPGEALVIELFL